MRFEAFRASLIEVALSFEVLGVSLADWRSAVRAWRPTVLAPEPAPAPMHVSWAHDLPTSWPGNYTRLWFAERTAPLRLACHLNATPDSPGLAEALPALRAALSCTGTAAVVEAELWLNGDGYGASLATPLSRSLLEELLADATVIDMDPRFDDRWDPAIVRFTIERTTRGNLRLVRC